MIDNDDCKQHMTFIGISIPFGNIIPYVIFAYVHNTNLRRFNSLFWFPELEGVDAFSQNWQKENNLLVPSICLISETVKYMINVHVSCKALGIRHFNFFQLAFKSSLEYVIW